MSSRLFQEAREQRGLCYDIHAFGWGYSDSGLFGVHAATGNSQVEELVHVIMTQLRAVAHDGPNEPELQRAKAQLKASLLMSLESSEARAGQVARDTLMFGRQLTTAELIERIENVSAGRCRRAGGGFRDDEAAGDGERRSERRIRPAARRGREKVRPARRCIKHESRVRAEPEARLRLKMQ